MKNGKRQVPLKRMPRSLPTETVPRRTRSTKQKAFKDHPRRLRKSITPGTVLIVLAGRHKAKVLIPLRLQVEVAASSLKLELELFLLWSIFQRIALAFLRFDITEIFLQRLQGRFPSRLSSPLA